MHSLNDRIELFIEKCDISFEGKTFSKELLMQTFLQFLKTTCNKEKHNVGVILHTNSLCFDIASITFAALLNLLSNEMTSEDVLENFEPGDMVLYGGKKKERFIFEKIVLGKEIGAINSDRRYAVISQKNSIRYVSEQKWSNIEPYNGSSQRLDGRGIREKKNIKAEFFRDILKYDEKDIPSVIDTSSVIVMQRENAERIVRGVCLLTDGKKYPLLELITASYLTEDDEYIMGSNPGKGEAVLKFCSKVSVARHLLLARDGNRHIGIFVLGQNFIERGQTELPELIRRKSIQYVYVSTLLENMEVLKMFEEQEPEVFACTPDFLLEHVTVGTIEENQFTSELKDGVDTIINKECKTVLVEDAPFDEKHFCKMRKSLISMKRSEYTSTSKDNFILQSFSLINLFCTAIFPLNRIEKAREAGATEINSAGEKIETLKKILNELPAILYDDAYFVLKEIERAYTRILESTSKGQWISRFLYKNGDKRIAIVVPKAYYASVIRAGGIYSAYTLRNVSIMTPGRFDGGQMYDEIIAVGNITGKRFNIFTCNSAVSLTTILYPFELEAYNGQKSIYSRMLLEVNKKSTIELKDADENVLDKTFLEEVKEEKELEDYIYSLDASLNLSSIEWHGEYGKTSIMTDIISIATFSDDTKAFFSKHYKAYVVDDVTGIVKEVNASDLCEGDSVVFTNNNEDTKDIVDSILRQLLEAGKLTSQMKKAYEISKKWKQALREYLEKCDFNIQTAASEIAKAADVQYQTAIYWMDEDSHTVGPRKVESIIAIATLTNDSYLIENAELCFESCREIRSLRRKILSEVGNAIINNLSGNYRSTGTELDVIQEKIETLSEVLQIERIVETTQQMPLSLANKPINLG